MSLQLLKRLKIPTYFRIQIQCTFSQRRASIPKTISIDKRANAHHSHDDTSAYTYKTSAQSTGLLKLLTITLQNCRELWGFQPGGGHRLIRIFYDGAKNVGEGFGKVPAAVLAEIIRFQGKFCRQRSLKIERTCLWYVPDNWQSLSGKQVKWHTLRDMLIMCVINSIWYV